MFNEVLNTCISAIVDGLEGFFDVVTYPSRKYIKTALFIACGFLAMSLVGLLLDFVLFVNYYEAITAIIILLIIYFVSDISASQVQDTANLMMAKTSKVINKTKKQLAQSSKSKKKSSAKKKPTKRPK